MSEIDPQGKTTTIGKHPDWKILLVEARKEGKAEAQTKTESQNLKDVCEELGIELKPISILGKIQGWIERVFGLALVCSIIFGVPYVTFRDRGKLPLSLWGFKDNWAFFVMWLGWAGAAWGLWHYLFIDKDWKNSP